MPHEPGPAYDSFVLRLWRETASGRLLRAEVEHLQTGAVHVGRGIVPGWILDTLRACVGLSSPREGADRGGQHPGKERNDASDGVA
jgi:hypothetical protein